MRVRRLRSSAKVGRCSDGDPGERGQAPEAGAATDATRLFEGTAWVAAMNGAHDSVHRFTKAWRAERARAPWHAEEAG